ncbi:response regulator [Candidatus Sumerlaeota bacterium]|nr:response regulator [Candidatus Sumerlaeota bacterium]
MALSSLPLQIQGRILVVEDEAVVRDLLSEILTQQGHKVATAGDGSEALDLLRKNSFDMVLSDLQMPGLSGLDLISSIKSRQPTLPVVVVSGYPALNKAIDAMKAGATDFITKPFRIDHIHHVVQKTLQEQRLLVENQRLMAELNNAAVIEKLNRQLSQKVRQLTKLYRVSESFHSEVDNRLVFQYVVGLAAELTDARRVSLLSLDRTHKRLVFRAARGVSPDVERTTVIPIGEGVAGQVALAGRPMRVTSRDYAPGRNDDSRGYLSHSWISVPVFIAGELFGVLNLTDRKDLSDFTEEDEHLAVALAEKAGVKIENNVLYEGLYANLLDTLKVLVSTIEAKDPYTRYHSQRVTETSLVIARRAQCTEEECESIAFAGILHDIGKIGIQDSILLKPSFLTRKEYDIVKRHPIVGDMIVEPLGLIDVERDIIRHHHERLDGKGYPDGLRGKEIPLLSRIVSLADAFDAMTSTRSYRQAMSIPDALAELAAHSGTQFDPDLVRTLVGACEAGEMGDAAEDASVVTVGPGGDPVARLYANGKSDTFLKNGLKNEGSANDQDNIAI